MIFLAHLPESSELQLREREKVSGLAFQPSAPGAFTVAALQLVLQIRLEARQVCVQPSDVFIHLHRVRSHV